MLIKVYQEHRILQPPNSHELQIAIRSTGICGSDLHYYRHGRNGDIMVREPLVLGHESAGEVIAIGDKVIGFNTGDRVALEVGLPCEECHLCIAGRYNLCEAMRFRSSAKSYPHFQGTLQEKLNHPARWCHKLPYGIPYQLGALLEPLGVAIHAIRRARICPGVSTLVFGAGAIGLLCAYMTKRIGAGVVIADIDKGRVNFAVDDDFADDHYIISRKQGQTIEEKLEFAKDIAAKVGALKNAQGIRYGGFDTVLECTGAESCVQAAIYATKPGGRVMLIGMGSPVQTLPLAAAALREVDLCGVFRYANTYDEGIRCLSDDQANLVNLKKLITHQYQGLNQAQGAFDMAGRTVDKTKRLVLKVMVNIDGSTECLPSTGLYHPQL